ncbi:MAG: tRNA epoxyqueuosine(34) reductase QueG [Candidatus Marinimicrobia bacterium]|nr:tRNA epoxyqueuosine(34) reductase QueG [Candidatus Neomarinimicrobiota bacterium]
MDDRKVVDIADNQWLSPFKAKEKKYLSTRLVDKLVKNENISRYAVARPLLNTKFIEAYKNWLNYGFNADMQWMKNNVEERGNLLLKFPWARSVIVFADNYYCDKTPTPRKLKISRYAWGLDYHDVLQAKLKRILLELKKIDTSLDGRVYVDTGPILEKCYAIEAGLGWMGKNSQIIVPGIGSYVFLGIIIINQEFEEYGAPIKERCGDCRRCMEACPTGAIVRDKTLDSRRCISYISIEKKGDFSEQETKWLKNWLYGCDICLEICPWNRKWAVHGEEQRYYERFELYQKTPEEWLKITETEFGKIFHKSVIKRLKFFRFRRNLSACIDDG